jgi:signal transduction histidine kinase
MRERLVAAFVVVTLFGLAVFGVVRAYAIQGLIQRSEAAQVQRSSTLLATLVEERRDHSEPVSPQYLRALLGADEWVRYVDASGRKVLVKSAGYVGRPTPDDVFRTRSLPGGGTLTFARSQRFVNRAISDAVMPVVLLGAGIAVVAGLLGYVVARRLSRPFQELAQLARDLGRGRFDMQVPHFAIPEADVVARALETSAEQLHDLVVREREFVLAASHELNTPITALRLELEDLSMDRSLPPATAAQLKRSMGEVDRLRASVAQLLERAREHRVGVSGSVDVLEVARGVSSHWPRDLVAASGDQAEVRLAAGPVEQILEGLVGCAVEDGASPIDVEVTDLTDHVRVEVRGKGGSRIDVPTSAADVADALGAHLTADRGPALSFTLRLPRGL